MSTTETKSLLLLNPSSLSCSYSILFHCAKYWAQQGSRVLFISKIPLNNLPLALGKADVFLNPDAFKLIQFMYLANREELLRQLYSVHLRHNPVSVIIVKNLENYLRNGPQPHGREDDVALVCASLLYAATACAKVVAQPVFLMNEYVCENSTVERIVIRNFFPNVWQLKNNANADRRTFVKLSKLSFSAMDKIAEYRFCENLAESRLTFDEIIKNIINTY